MKLYSWNVNGIRAVLRKEKFHPFLEAHQPDILCLQETKAERGQIEIELPGYHEYWNSAVKKGYSGTAIFSKEEPLAVIKGFPDDFTERFRFADELRRDSSQEGRVITAEFKTFYVVTVYTPNTKDDLSRLALRFGHWDPAFLTYCNQLSKAKPVIFCGDLNVAHTELDLAHPKANRGKKGFTDEERKGFQSRAPGITRGGVPSPMRAHAISDGGSITSWCRKRYAMQCSPPRFIQRSWVAIIAPLASVLVRRSERAAHGGALRARKVALVVNFSRSRRLALERSQNL